MFAITSQAHNQNKFAFLLKMRLKTGYNRGSLAIFCFCQVTQPLLYDWRSMERSWWSVSASLPLPVMRVSCCSLLLSLVGSMGAPTRIQVSSIRWDRLEILGSINQLNVLGLINLRAKALAQKPKCSAKNTMHNWESGDLLFEWY